MKRKALFLLAIASVVMLALPTKAWADGMNEALEESSIKKKGVTARWLPYSMQSYAHRYGSPRNWTIVLTCARVSCLVFSL